MTAVNDTIGAGGVTPPATIKVWDRFVRVFHWSLATLFLVAYATGDEVEKVHIAAGYAIAGLVGARIFSGGSSARLMHASAALSDVRGRCSSISVTSRCSGHLGDIGHNPAGGAMILALLAMLIGISITGYMMTTDDYWGAKWVEEVHETLANLTIGLVVIHVLGVLVASFEHRENLIKSMITGRKRT